MQSRLPFNTFIAGLALAGLTGTVHAQWSLGAPGKREAPAGMNRYAWIVLANPNPGMEVEFNDWYQNTHMGDLVQLPGVTGAQRFRLVSKLEPRPTREGYRHGFMIVWDQEAQDPAPARALVTQAIAGGKSRRGAGFDYIGGLGGGGTFQVMGPRMTRPDGKGPFLPDVSDSKTPRPNRYFVMDYSSPAAGKEAEFDAATNQRIKDVLGLPGWMAAQRHRQIPPSAINPASKANPNKPQFLTMWEVEGKSVNELQATWNEGVKAGKVKPVPVDQVTAEFTYWEPISPHITKEDFVR